MYTTVAMKDNSGTARGMTIFFENVLDVRTETSLREEIRRKSRFPRDNLNANYRLDQVQKTKLSEPTKCLHIANCYTRDER